LNVDESRIGTNKRIPASTSKTESHVYGRFDLALRAGGTGFNPNIGRWPANLILQHKPGCEQAGELKVKSQNPKYVKPFNPKIAGATINITRPANVGLGYGDADGTETVDSWECDSGCPVSELDKQSLALGIHPAGNTKPAHFVAESSGFTFGLPKQDHNPNYYGDDGSVSRFFKQVGGKEPKP